MENITLRLGITIIINNNKKTIIIQWSTQFFLLAFIIYSVTIRQLLNITG